MLDDCFKNVIGITERDCDCFNEKPEGYNDSLSGLYIDDLSIGIPLSRMGASKDCGDGSVWDLMDKARDLGLRQFLTDFVVAIDATNRKSFSGFSGAFANHKDSHNLPIGGLKQYAFVKYTPLRYKGVMWEISALCVYFNASDPVEIFLYGSDDLNTPINSWQITPTAKKKTCYTLPVKEVLPLSKNGMPINYYFVFDTGENTPRNIKFDCGCGPSSKPDLYKYFAAGGFDTEDLNTLGSEFGKGTEYVNGVQPIGKIACDSSGWLCRDWDYWYDPYARVMARTMQFYMIIKGYEMILNSDRLNFTTISKREHIYGKIAHLKKEIEKSMMYLIANIPADASDCIVCDFSTFSKQLISV